MATRTEAESEMPARTLLAALAIAGLIEAGKVALIMPFGTLHEARAGGGHKGTVVTEEKLMEWQTASQAGASASAHASSSSSSSSRSGAGQSECSSEATATTTVDGVQKEVHQSRKATGGPGGCSARSHAESRTGSKTGYAPD
jgi:hypothetical protein